MNVILFPLHNLLNLLPTVALGDVTIYLIDIRLKCSGGVVEVLEQQVHPDLPSKMILDSIYHIPSAKVLFNELLWWNPTAFSSFPCLDKLPGEKRLLVDIENLN